MGEFTQSHGNVVMVVQKWDLYNLLCHYLNDSYPFNAETLVIAHIIRYLFISAVGIIRYCDEDFSPMLNRVAIRRHLHRCICELKAYTGKSKINPANKLPPVGIEPGTLGLCEPLWPTPMPSILS